MELAVATVSGIRDSAPTVPASMKAPKIELCCELQLKAGTQSGLQAVRNAAVSWLTSSGLTIALGMHDPQRVGVPLLAEACSSIRIEPALISSSSLRKQRAERMGHEDIPAPFVGSCPSSSESNPLVFPYCQARMTVLPYVLHDSKTGDVMMETEENENVCVFQKWALPNKEFENLWENLHFDDSIKATLLKYTSTALVFSDKNVDSKASNFHTRTAVAANVVNRFDN